MLKNYISLIPLLAFCSIFCSPNYVFAQDEPEVNIGGAVRFNYNLSSWKPGQKARGGDFGYDVFIINADAKFKGIYLEAEYRLYSDAFGGGFLKYGLVGYELDEKRRIELGLAEVPFGIERYNSHNWFLNLPYYVGLEDDYDMGVDYIYNDDRFQYHVGFFKNAEEFAFGSNTPSSPHRYSYDVVGRNKEVNQFNTKFIWKPLSDNTHKIGVSGQYGGLYNIDTEETGDHYAVALHYEYQSNDWSIKGQATKSKLNPKNAPGESRDIVSMGAYGVPYQVAADFEIYTLGIAKKLTLDTNLIKYLEFYDDFGYMNKRKKEFANTFMNVFGVLINSGPIFTYIDYAAGYNHSWLGGDFTNEFAAGMQDAKWEARFNINIGYYF
ncbi:hypothetical protein [Salegentibacter mishustinae]|jgi:hypothetical protein|uniref:hypothetical protein n=1 Tax=Salegentibacter mishustinae TaxID=270918 RepID=UPI0024934811|nr:hypothetical protein [Salegentibacter mishustinae]MDX1427903.1 hypothetical protein [Salegentibacter mishustinae]